MKPRIELWCGLAAAGLGLGLLAGCDYSAAPDRPLAPGGRSLGGYIPSSSRTKTSGLIPKVAASARASEERAAILESSITLIQRAALSPGGDNFRLAVQKLNHYFDGTPPPEYLLDSASRAYLQTQLPLPQLKELENRTWSPLRDTRHIEDCMMYYGIATRVAGTGENLARVRRVFDWAMRQVQLVPAGSLRSERLGQAFARPYDVLLRGMATEAEGFWAERSWLFMVLCRQLGIDTGLITYTKSNTLEPLFPRYGSNVEVEATLVGVKKLPNPPIIWICTALIDGHAYLFDARLGLAIPGPDGDGDGDKDGVATLEQAMSDPAILERMNLLGQSPYGTSQASLLASPTKIGILLDSSQGYFSPKMKLLQNELAGKNRTILHRDVSEQRDHFAKVLGDKFGGVGLWMLPFQVEERLFKDPQFVQSIQASLYLFRPEFPLLYARIKHLRGDVDEAIQEYINLRLKENAPLVTDKKKTIPKEVQDALDIYATYYLALAHLDKNSPEHAARMFNQALELLPEPGPNQPYYNMFRWGANANLGRIYEARKDNRSAIAHYCQRDPTVQYVGNLLRARELVWRDPMAPRPDPLPAAPAPRLVVPKPIAANIAPPSKAAIPPK